MTKEQALDWIRDFLKEVDSQDNRATAHPIQFLLQTKQEYVAHPEYHHNTRTVFHHHIMENGSQESHEDAVKYLIDYGYEGKKLDEEIEAIEQFEIGHHWETSQMFFTEKGVKRHIEANGHNLKCHRDYVVHAFRNPEMSELFECLRELVK